MSLHDLTRSIHLRCSLVETSNRQLNSVQGIQDLGPTTYTWQQKSQRWMGLRLALPPTVTILLMVCMNTQREATL